MRLGDFLPRPFGMMAGLAVIALLLGWVAARYDILTAAFAVTSAVLWNMNYPLLAILQDLGNGGQWLVFALWGAVMAFAAACAFRPALNRARQRMAAALQ